MNITDVMLREIAEAECEEKREREMREYDREVKKRLARRRFHAAVDMVCIGLAIMLLALLAWCCLSNDAHCRGFFGGNESRTERECAPAK